MRDANYEKSLNNENVLEGATMPYHLKKTPEENASM